MKISNFDPTSFLQISQQYTYQQSDIFNTGIPQLGLLKISALSIGLKESKIFANLGTFFQNLCGFLHQHYNELQVGLKVSFNKVIVHE